jgi:hypothetical protein
MSTTRSVALLDGEIAMTTADAARPALRPEWQANSDSSQSPLL